MPMRKLAIFFYLLFCLCCAYGEELTPKKATCPASIAITSDNVYATLQYGDSRIEAYTFFPNKLFRQTSFPIQLSCLYFKTTPIPPFFRVIYNVYTPFLIFKKYTSSCTFQIAFDIYKGFLFSAKSSDPAHLQCQWDEKNRTFFIHQLSKPSKSK